MPLWPWAVFESWCNPVRGRLGVTSTAPIAMPSTRGTRGGDVDGTDCAARLDAGGDLGVQVESR